jgi:Sec-independent protein translocase protein TatA
MSIGFGQICLVALLALLLFGNMPNIKKDLKNTWIFLTKNILKKEKQDNNKITKKRKKIKRLKH